MAGGEEGGVVLVVSPPLPICPPRRRRHPTRTRDGIARVAPTPLPPPQPPAHQQKRHIVYPLRPPPCAAAPVGMAAAASASMAATAACSGGSPGRHGIPRWHPRLLVCRYICDVKGPLEACAAAQGGGSEGRAPLPPRMEMALSPPPLYKRRWHLVKRLNFLRPTLDSQMAAGGPLPSARGCRPHRPPPPAIKTLPTPPPDRLGPARVWQPDATDPLERPLQPPRGDPSRIARARAVSLPHPLPNYGTMSCFRGGQPPPPPPPRTGIRGRLFRRQADLPARSWLQRLRSGAPAAQATRSTRPPRARASRAGLADAAGPAFPA